MTSEERIDSSNGIWLCQTCAKLIDSDTPRFNREALEAWKRSAEHAAAVALTRGRSGDNENLRTFAKAESLMPALLQEMRADLIKNPTCREFILLKRTWSYNFGSRQILVYFLEEHENLEGKMQVLENLGLVRDITYNNTQRYLFEEEFVDYLMSASAN